MHAKPGLVDHLADLLSMREFVDPQRLARYVGEHLRTQYRARKLGRPQSSLPD